MKSFWTDLRYARRALLRAPVFTILAISTMALGIGVTTAVFAVVEGVVLRPLPYPDADRLVRVLHSERDGRTVSVAWPDFRDWREQAEGFEAMAAYTEAEATFGWDEGAQQLTGAYVTAGYFDLMGVPLAEGRDFSEEDDQPGGPAGIIVSHEFWRTKLGSTPSVVGRTVPMDGESVPILGVAAEGFEAPYEGTQYWEPMRGDQVLASVGLPTGTRDLGFQSVIGRLEPGVDRETIEAELRALAQRIDRSVGKSEARLSRLVLSPLSDSLVGDVRATLFFLLAAAGLVLLVAAANVAGLALSRSATRERELAVRTAIGAGRGRLLRQLLTEAAVVSALAGVLGGGAAWLLQDVLLGLAPAGLPRADGIHMNGITITFALGVTLFSGLVFGLFPAWRASRIDLALGLAGGRGSSGSRRALLPQQLLVSAQVAVSVVLMVAATLLVNSFSKLNGVDRGFDATSVVVATVGPTGAQYETPAQLDAFYSDLLERTRALPGVVSATTTYSPPLFGTYFKTTVTATGVEEDPSNKMWAGTVIIRDGYFETTGTPLIMGRQFGPGDRLGEPLVVIVNEVLAERLWPGEDAIGKQLTYTGGLSGSADSFRREFFPDSPMTVVGVAGDVRRESLSEAPGPEYYRPHSQLTWGFQFLVVRASADVSDVAATVRNTVWAIDASIPVDRVQTMQVEVSESMATPRFRMILLASFGAFASLLAMVGLYAIMALAVSRRTREIGIRIALGARRDDVLRSVLANGLRLAGWGAAVGVLVAYVGSAALSQMLFEVKATDPLTYVGVVLVTGAVALGACYLPAIKASRVDPMVSLQEE